MPRRKRAFIDRSRARTYEVVYRPLADRGAGPERVLRAVPRGNASDPTVPDAGHDGDALAYVPADVVDADVQEWEANYAARRDAFEYGEYGLPDDGYDYAQHFKTIGGGGGAVFVPRGGKFDAEATTHAVEGDATLSGVDAIRELDEKRKGDARAEIQRLRKHDRDLDEVFAALESSDAETDRGEEGTGGVSSRREVCELGQDADDISDSDIGLADEFVALAGVKEKVSPSATLDSAAIKPREDRLLDREFDDFLRQYEDDSDDSEGDKDGESSDLGDLRAESEELKNGFGNSQRGAASASVSSDTQQVGCKSDAELDDDMLHELTADLNVGGMRLDNNMEKAMDSLIGEYKRATVDETYGPDALRAPEALEGVRRAVPQEFEERSVGELQEPRDRVAEGTPKSSPAPGAVVAGDGGEDPSEESDDALEYEVLSQRRTESRWDCETILSTYSNLENHPSIIDDRPGPRRGPKPQRRDPVIRLDPRINAPADYLPGVRTAPERDGSGGDAEIEEASGDGNRYCGPKPRTAEAHVHVRDKNESSEEKRARKAAAKSAARERRAEKSATKKAFAKEFGKQDKHAARLGNSKVSVRF